MNCWSCQVENPSAAKFCFNCGSRLAVDPATEAPCRSCGAPLPLDARFCGNCGTPSPVVSAPAEEGQPAPAGLADLLEPAVASVPLDAVASVPLDAVASVPLDADASPAADAAAMAYDHEEEEEATVSRPGLEEPPLLRATPGLKSRDHSNTEPAKVAVARTLAERLGRSGDSPGAYSKQGPSLRKTDPKGKPPPPPAIGGKASGAEKGDESGAPKEPPARKPATEQSLPRAGLPVRPLAGADATARPAEKAAKLPPVPSLAPRPVARPAAATPRSSTASTPKGPAAAAPSPAPVGKKPTPAKAPAPKARTTTEPQKAVFASPQRSEVADILAPTAGWPDITDELAEVRFSALQGVDAGVFAELAELRRKYPGHPEVEALVHELGSSDALSLEDSLELPIGVPRRTRPPVQPEPSPLTSIDGPPPLGRFPVTQPPSSSPSQPPGTGAGAGAVSRPGAPRPAPIETSDELLDVDADEFDDLDDPDAGESMTDMTIVERLDLERLGVRDADELDDPDDVADDLDEPDEPDFVDRTMMVPSLQPPAPFSGAGAKPTPASRPAGERRATLAPDLHAVDERRRATLAPGSDALDDERRRATLAPGSDAFDDERRSTLPPGSLMAEHDDPPTLAGLEAGEPSFIPDDATPVPEPARATLAPQATPAPFGGPGAEPSPDGFMTAPDRDADTAAASGTFRVADLGLDDMPDLTAGLPPEPDEVELDVDLELTEEGTVVARAPLPPAPYGQENAALPVVPVRLVMLGARGEAVTERRIEPGAFLDLGRQPGEPWAEDRRMEPLHARLFPSPGGIVVDDFGLPSGVYTQIFDTIAVGDGDEFKVGQARLALQRVTGRGWGQITLVRHDSPEPVTIVLDRDEIIIGRDEGDITLPGDTFVSGDHCRFIREGNAIYLEDLGSSNGTYIRVRAGQCVAFGGLILVGHTQFRVQPG